MCSSDLEDALKEETLSDYLQEYESQPSRLKEQLNFQRSEERRVGKEF